MKELSIEEKAKAYDKALEKARQLCAYPTTKPFISDLQDLFPELKESEDEKIRKTLKHYLEVRRCQTQSDEEYINCNNFLAWLEKQGEQKPTLRERYKNIAKSEWFKKTHEGMSVSDDDNEQKPWSEEDELMFISTIQGIEMTNGAAQLKIDWLKSLKERIGGRL